MKLGFAAATLFAASQALAIEKDVKIVTGIFYGITQEEGLTELTNCMQHSDRFVDEIFHGFEIMLELDLRSVIAGTRSISRAVHHLPTYLSECKASGPDIKALESWAHIFIEPVNLVKTIAGNANHHSIRVAADVLRTREAIKNQEWF